MRPKSIFSLLAVSICALALAGCGSNLEGEYANQGVVYTFDGEGKGTMAGVLPGEPPAFTYEVDGDEIIISFGEGSRLVFTKVDENTVKRNDGLVLTRRSE